MLKKLSHFNMTEEIIQSLSKNLLHFNMTQANKANIALNHINVLVRSIF